MIILLNSNPREKSPWKNTFLMDGRSILRLRVMSGQGTLARNCSGDVEKMHTVYVLPKAMPNTRFTLPGVAACDARHPFACRRLCNHSCGGPVRVPLTSLCRLSIPHCTPDVDADARPQIQVNQGRRAGDGAAPRHDPF